MLLCVGVYNSIPSIPIWKYTSDNTMEKHFAHESEAEATADGCHNLI